MIQQTHFVRFITAALITAGMVFTAQSALAQPAGYPFVADPGLSHWMQLGLKNNPQLQADYYQWQSLLAAGKSAGSLPDPLLSFDYFIDEIQTRTGPQEYRIALAQKFPWFGKRSLQSEIAKQKAHTALHEFSVNKLTLQQAIANLWGEAIHLEKLHGIANENLALLEQFERIARTRYRLAKAAHPDLIRVQLQVSRTKNQISTLERKKKDLQANLGSLTNQEIPQSFSWPLTYPELPSLPNRESLQASMLTQNPELKKFHQQIEINQKQAELEQLNTRPDFTLKYGRMFTDEAINPNVEGSGDDPQFVGISVNIPLWFENNQQKIKAARLKIDNGNYAKAAFKNRLIEQLEQAIYQYQDSDEQLARFSHALIPQAENALTTLIKSYQTGKSNFVDLIEMEKLLLTLKKDQAQLEQARWQAYCTIHALTANFRSNNQVPR